MIANAVFFACASLAWGFYAQYHYRRRQREVWAEAPINWQVLLILSILNCVGMATRAIVEITCR